MPEVSERRACNLFGQSRSTQRRKPYIRADEPRLIAEMIELATQYGRYGYPFRLSAFYDQSSLFIETRDPPIEGHTHGKLAFIVDTTKRWHPFFTAVNFSPESMKRRTKLKGAVLGK